MRTVLFFLVQPEFFFLGFREPIDRGGIHLNRQWIKIITDFAMSTIAYFFIGYGLAYGINFMSSAQTLKEKNGYELVSGAKSLMLEDHLTEPQKTYSCPSSDPPGS